jgi:hypothetical protein
MKRITKDQYLLEPLNRNSLQVLTPRRSQLRARLNQFHEIISKGKNSFHFRTGYLVNYLNSTKTNQATRPHHILYPTIPPHFSLLHPRSCMQGGSRRQINMYFLSFPLTQPVSWSIKRSEVVIFHIIHLAIRYESEVLLQVTS